VEGNASLRERKKQATRQSLHEAALRLAVARGLEGVTVEAVADEANVSRRTFSNYFANKEDALLYGEQVRVGRLLAELRRRPRAERPWQALCNTAAAPYTDLDELDPKWLEQLRLVRRHPSVLARQLAFQAAFERDLAAEIASRSPDSSGEPLRSRVTAATFLAVLRAATSLWIEEEGLTPLSTRIAEALDRVAEAFA
jgi:AcrR family transcriptional regulator